MPSLKIYGPDIKVFKHKEKQNKEKNKDKSTLSEKDQLARKKSKTDFQTDQIKQKLTKYSPFSFNRKKESGLQMQKKELELNF